MQYFSGALPLGPRSHQGVAQCSLTPLGLAPPDPGHLGAAVRFVHRDGRPSQISLASPSHLHPQDKNLATALDSRKSMKLNF
jgi:hypothetical protein